MIARANPDDEMRIQGLARVRLDPADTLVVKLSRYATDEQAVQIKSRVQAATGHERVLVITEGISLTVVESRDKWPKVVD